MSDFSDMLRCAAMGVFLIREVGGGVVIRGRYDEYIGVCTGLWFSRDRGNTCLCKVSGLAARNDRRGILQSSFQLKIEW